MVLIRGSVQTQGEGEYQLVLQGTALGSSALDLFTSEGCIAVVKMIHWILSCNQIYAFVYIISIITSHINKVSLPQVCLVSEQCNSLAEWWTASIHIRILLLMMRLRRTCEVGAVKDHVSSWSSRRARVKLEQSESACRVGAVGKHVLSWSSRSVCRVGAVGECVLSWSSQRVGRERQHEVGMCC